MCSSIFELLEDDDSYALFLPQVSEHETKYCSKYQKCEVVTAPFSKGYFPGGIGWIFPKRSPFLPIFNYHFWQLNEADHKRRIYNKPEYKPSYLWPAQECEDLDGQPISMFKSMSPIRQENYKLTNNLRNRYS